MHSLANCFQTEDGRLITSQESSASYTGLLLALVEGVGQKKVYLLFFVISFQFHELFIVNKSLHSTPFQNPAGCIGSMIITLRQT